MYVRPVAVRMTLVALIVWAGVVWRSPTADAHKAITSRFTYNADVYPIFIKRCSHCHVAGGVGPMSLVSYDDAFPWAESLRSELLEGNSGEDFIDAAHRELSARELDVVLDWAVGGTPEGAGQAPVAPELHNGWAGAQPDLVLAPDAPFDIPAETMEVTREFVFHPQISAERSVSAIDLLPGTPAVVRDAVILMRKPGTPPQLLGTWVPRQTPSAIAVKSGTSLLPGSEIVARIHYKKTWKYEGQAMTDRSSVGIYFAR